MRIRELEVRDFGPIGHVRLTFPDRGATVLHAPNETGKTTLVQAFFHLLLTKHTSSASDKRTGGLRAIGAFEPKGRAAGSPYVRAVLQIGDETVTAEKRWLSRAYAYVVVENQTKSTRTVYKDGQADSWLRNRLDKEVGALRTISAGQDSGGEPPAILSSELLEAALSRTKLGSLLVDPELLGRIDARLRELGWSRQGRGRGAIPELRERLQNLEEQLSDLEQEREKASELRQRFHEIAKRIQAQKAALSELDARRRALEQELAQMDSREALQEQVYQARQQAEEARRALEELRNKRSQLGELRQRETALQEELDRFRDECERKEAELAKLEEELARSNASFREHLQSLGEVRERIDAVRAWQRRLELTARLEARRRLLERARGLTEEVERRRHRASAAPDKQDVRRAEELHERIERIEARLSSSAPEVRVEAKSSITLDCDGHPESLPAGTVREYRPLKSLSLEAEGLALRIDVPARESEGELAKLKADLAKLLAEHGVESSRALRTRLDEAEEEAKQVEHLKERLKDILGDGSLESLEQEIMSIQAELESLPAPPDLSAHDISRQENELTGQLAQGETRMLEEQARLKVLSETVDREREHHARLREEVARIRAELEAVTQRLDEVKDQLGYGDHDQQELGIAQQIKTFDEALSAAQEQLEKRTRQEKELDALRQSLELTKEALWGLQKELTEVQTRLQTPPTDDDWTKRQEELADVRRELASREQEAKALELVARVLQESNREAKERYEMPYRSELEGILSTLWHEPTRVQLDDQLRVNRVVRGEGSSVREFELADLSAGAKEQVAVAARLAAARLAADIPLFLDDAVLFSDALRTDTLVRELQSMRDRQVVIMTAHPERYAGTAAAQILDLRDVMSASPPEATPVRQPRMRSHQDGDKDAVLAALEHLGGRATLGDLSTRTELPPVAIRRALRELERSGHVAVEGKTRGRRYVLVHRPA